MQVYSVIPFPRWAVREGHCEAVEELLKFEGIDVDRKGGWNQCTALMRAVQRGYTEVVKKLLEAQANVNAENEVSNSTGRRFHPNEVINYMTQYKMTALMLAAEVTDEKIKPFVIEIAKLLIRKNATQTAKYSETRNTALILAAEIGNVEFVEMLLDINKTDVWLEMNDWVNFKNWVGKTAFILASEFGHFNVVDKLANDSRTRLDDVSDRGMSAIMFASLFGYRDIVDLLLSKLSSDFITETTKSLLEKQNKPELIAKLGYPHSHSSVSS